MICHAFLALAAVMPITLLAENACTDIHSKEERLACYDRESSYRAPEGDRTIEPNPAISFRVRNETKFHHTSFPEFGNKNAELVFERSSGDTFALANAAVLAVFPAVNDDGWQPYAFGSWKRSESAEKKSDYRDVGIGIVTAFGDPRQGKLAAMVTPRMMRRTDIYSDKNSSIVSIHADIGRSSWFSSNLDATDQNVYAFLPFVGTMYEDRNGSGDEDGAWSSAYAGLSLGSKLNRITPRLQMTLTYQYFHDFAVPTAGNKRSDDHASLSVAYEFTDPEDKSIKVRPAIFISREIGLNPLSGPDPVNRTKLGFGIRVDTF